MVEAIRAVSKVIGGPPSVLFISWESLIPWELMAVKPPLEGSEPKGSRFLGAQARVGRWAFNSDPPPSGINPPTRRGATSARAVVITGDYSKVPDLRALTESIAEAAGVPAADVIHFALHGDLGHSLSTTGLLLLKADGTATDTLDPRKVRAGDLTATRPMVFLNACLAGAGMEFLGQNAGLADAFVAIGAAAAIAPQWSVDDKVARQFAASLYRDTLAAASRVEVAEFLRRQRASITSDAVAADGFETSALTPLAYAFFGHPSFTLD